MSKGVGRISALAVGRKTVSESNANGGLNGSTMRLLKLFEASVNPASLAANTGAETDVTVTGVTTDDMIVSVEAHSAAVNNGISFTARIKSANTVSIHFVNATAGAIDIAATTFKILVARIADADQ
jgi:hypothetical protein